MTILLAATPLLADEVIGYEQLLCSSVHATECLDSGECAGGLPWVHNVPQFIRIDLEELMLSTTEASGQNRSTPIKEMERHDEAIILQGNEMGRAFSIVISEVTGRASIAVAADGEAVVVFAACTPIEDLMEETE
jgi:hypothetical protein